MKRISSTSTVFLKRVFPTVWFGFLALFVVLALVRGIDIEREWMFVLGPCCMALIGFFLMKKLVWDLADEVYDCGDFLVVKYRGEEDTVPLSNVMNVSISTNSNPPRITLRLVRPGRFGSEIAFCPLSKFSLNPFAKIPIAEDLIIRVDQARVSRAV